MPYALTGCRPSDGATFEAHVLQCDACFEDLQLLDQATALIGDWQVARLTLADLFYNAPHSQGTGDELRAILDSLAPLDEGESGVG